MLKANPEFTPARAVLGLAYLGKADVARAAKELEIAAAQSPKTAVFHYYLAGPRPRGPEQPRGRPPGLRGGAAAGPDLLEARLELAARSGTKPDQQFLAKRIEDLRRAVEKSPDNPALRHALAVALAAAGDLKAAEPELRKAVELSPGYVPANFMLAPFASRRGRRRGRRAPQGGPAHHPVAPRGAHAAGGVPRQSRAAGGGDRAARVRAAAEPGASRHQAPPGPPLRAGGADGRGPGAGARSGGGPAERRRTRAGRGARDGGRKPDAAIEAAQQALRLNLNLATAHFALGAAYQ